MLWQDSCDRRNWAGQPGQNSRRRQEGWYSRTRNRGQDGQNMTEGQAAGTGQLRWDNCGRTVMTVKLGHDIWDMTLTHDAGKYSLGSSV
jgi:hypothetical protein